MVILTADQMRGIDQRSEREHGISADVLMDNAGREIAVALLRRHPDLASRRLLILCGKGNNGGDGITAARHLRERGVQARVALLRGASDLQGAAANALARARGAGLLVEEVLEQADWAALRRWLAENDVIVDALLGTGVRGAAAGPIKEAIDAVNAAGCEIVSVDIPSGLSGGSSEVEGPCVEADVTYALGALKIPHVFPPACDRVGEVEVLDIGIPAAAVEAEGIDLHWLDAETAALLVPDRERASHKGDYGHALIVAGSRGKSGAAVLMARACLRSGAGLVTIATPASVQPVVAAGCPEAMTAPLPETQAGTLARSALPGLREVLEDKDVLALGPGLTTDPETAAVVRGLVLDARVPMVLDADALNALAAAREKGVQAFAGPAVMTPHPGEAGRLLGVTAASVQQDRVAAARKIAAEWGACVLLKGHRSLVADPGGQVRVNSTGNPGMATGGAGDVLTGIAAAWLAQRLTPFNAATLSAYVHGLAGDLAARETGEISLTAGDLVEHLPRAYRALAGARVLG